MAERKLKRKESKKRKLRAYFDMAEINDNDEAKKEQDKAVFHNEKELYTDEEYLKKKKFLKIRSEVPRMKLKEAGEYGSLKLDSTNRTPIFMSDVRNMLVNAITKTHKAARWACITNGHRLSQIITVIVEGISIMDLQKASNSRINNKEEITSSENYPVWLRDSLPRASKCMEQKLELLAPSKYSEPPCRELLNVPLSDTKKDKLVKRYRNLKRAERSGLVHKAVASLFPLANVSSKELIQKKECDNIPFYFEDGKKFQVHDNFDRRRLLLGAEDMCDHGFPAPVPGCLGYNDPEYSFSHEEYTEVTVNSPMFGVDCEMCLTSIKQLELTSISVVNEQGKLVYHTLVKPKNRIINYLTKYSGITEEKLRFVKKTLKDVQNDLRNILPTDAILVGHSLNSDLKAMKMMHPYVIDSSLIYNLTHCRKRRSSLKLLTKMYLKRDIQENTSGHDPSEDAKASLELVLHKLKYDIAYGDVIQGAKIVQSQHEVDIDSEKQADTYKENEPFSTAVEGNPHAYAYSLFQVNKSMNLALVATPAGIKHYEELFSNTSQTLPHVEVVAGNKQISQKAAQLSAEKDFILMHMKMDTPLKKCNTPESQKALLQKLDKRLSRICSCSPARSLITFIFTGSSMDRPLNERANGMLMCCIKKQD